MMTRTNIHQDLHYYGLKFIVLDKSTQDFFCASSEVVLFKADLEEFVQSPGLGPCMTGPDVRSK